MTLVNAARQAPDRSDATAIARSLDSPGAFAGVFERHHAAIHRYLARRLGADMADELAAETFAVAFAKRGRYDLAVADARPWLFGIATKLAHHHWRREERELRAYARTGVDPAAPAAATFVVRSSACCYGCSQRSWSMVIGSERNRRPVAWYTRLRQPRPRQRSRFRRGL